MLKFKWLTSLVLLILLLVITGCKNGDGVIKVAVKPVPVAVDAIKQAPKISIHEAALIGQISVVMELLATGQNLDSLDLDGRTALMYASFNGYTDLVVKLIEKGAKINSADLYGRTALMMASSGPYAETVKVLLNHQADPNMVDKEEHFTALMYAAAEGQMEVVKLLISNGADPSLKDIDGDNAFTFASNNGHVEVANLLKSLKK